MNQDVWEIIATIHNFLKSLREADSQSAIRMIDLVELRSKLRTKLEDLRTAITEQYSERDAYFVLFPLMAHCDELVQMLILDIKQLEWPSLQHELYQVIDAADLFYELLDNALSKPETLPLVYEVYYFCLNDGFYGRYSTNPERIAEYLQKLRKHIPLQPLTDLDTSSSKPARGAYLRIPNYVYYCGAGVLLLLFYFFLSDLASSWQPS